MYNTAQQAVRVPTAHQSIPCSVTAAFFQGLSHLNATALCVVALLMCSGRASAEEIEAEVLGYMELRTSIHQGQGQLSALDTLVPALSTLSQSNNIAQGNALGFQPQNNWGVITRTRPTLKLHFGDQSLVMTPQAVTTHGFYERSANALADIITIERLYLSLSRGDFDVSMGKQLLSFGSGLLLNPTDTFNQRQLNDLNAELPGVWSTRILWALNDISNIQVAVALDEKLCCKPIAFLRYDTTLETTDFAAVVTYNGKKERLDMGIDIKGEWVLGAWIEALNSIDLRNVDAIAFRPTFELGIDYSFDVLQQLYVALEWIHQGDRPGSAWQGPNDPRPDYLMQRLQAGGTGLLAPNYVVLLSRLSINDKLQANLMGLLNIADPSGMALGQLVYWPNGVLELIAGAQYLGGAAGTETNMVIPRLPLVPELLRGQRLNPQWTFWLWGKVFF